ncbi:MAG TPA: translocation/assembly module TamB domain-containing protein [Steroidobacteraceae bacterium]|nr:translocation/assembly module TamB domain-containing protein [Steroidobacteraceae bacterium]
MPRALRITVWTLGGVLLLIVMLCAAVLIAGNTAAGRALIVRITARLSDGHVRLAGLGGSFPSQIDLGRFELSDDVGVWLTIEGVSLRWSPLAMLDWHVKVQSVRAARVDIARRPVNHSTSHGKPRLPVIDVGQLTIDALVLERPLAGIDASLTVRGSGHLDSLEDARLHLIAHRTNGSGDYEVQWRFNPERMDAQVNLEEPAGGPLEHLAQLPGLGTLRVVGSLAGPRKAEQIQLEIHAGALHANVQGTVNLSGHAARLDYSLESPALSPHPGLAWQRAALEGRWVGPFTAPQANGRLSIDALELPDGTRLGSLSANLNGSRGTLQLDATASGVVVPRVPSQLLRDPFRLVAMLRLDAPTRPLQLTLTQRLLALQAQAVTAGKRSATFTLTLPNLAPLAVLARQDVRGTATFTGKLVQQSPAAVRLDLDATARSTGPRVPAALSTARLRLAANLTEASVDIERLSVTGNALTFSASGSARRGTGGTGASGRAPGASASRGPGNGSPALRARWSLDLPNLAALAPQLQGRLRMTGQLAGTPSALGAELQGETTLSIRGSPTGTLGFNVQAHGLPSSPAASIEAKGSFAGAPLELVASFARGRGDQYLLEIERTDWKSVHVDANVTTGVNLSRGTGSVRLRIADLADLDPLIGKPLTGSVAGELSLSPDGGRTRGKLQIEGRELSAGNIKVHATLSGSGPLDALQLQLDAQSPDVRGDPLSLTAGAQLDLLARTLDLKTVQATYRRQSLRLLSPSRIAFRDGVQIGAVRLGLQHAALEVEGELLPELDLRASVRGLDAPVINSFVPNLLAQGALSAAARLRGTVAAPLGRVSLEVQALRFADTATRDLPLLNLHLNAQLQGTAAEVDAGLSAGSGSQLTLAGHAPLKGGDTVDLKLTGKLDAAFANPLLEAHGARAAGTLTVDATVTGEAQAPEIGGAIELAHGDLRDYGQGIHLGDITAHLVGGQGILRIASLTARAGSGEISMTGTLGVLQRKMPIDVKLTAKNAQPITNDILTANLGADMTLKGTLREQMAIAGTVHVNRALIGIPNSLPPNVAVLNVIRPGQAPPAPVVHRVVITLDITVDAPREILVQGRGLNAELGGRVRIQGTTLTPRVSGGFQLIRGTFSLASAQLNFTMGDVSFNGTGLREKIDPTLDFTAQASAADATVTMHITGFADSPKFELNSSPPLPQDEILARLLFGVSASQLTAVQVAQIGAALVSLTGVGGGGLNPLEKIQKALGLNVLTVGSAPNTGTNPNQNTGASVTAGRYVSSRVFVAASQSTTGISQLQVNVDLTQHLRLQTRIGNGTATAQGVTPDTDPGSSIGLTYQFQY